MSILDSQTTDVGPRFVYDSGSPTAVDEPQGVESTGNVQDTWTPGQWSGRFFTDRPSDDYDRDVLHGEEARVWAGAGRRVLEQRLGETPEE